MNTAGAAAVVTGHSRGLGAAIAEHLLARKVPVLALARHGNPDLAKRFGALLQQVTLDLANADAVTHWLGGETLRRFLKGPESALLVNNAGVLQPIGPLQNQEPPDVARAVTVNVTAPLMLSAGFIAATHRARERRILHVSSGAGRKAYAGWSVYCATKAALDHHARAVAMDQTSGLKICSLAPGVVDTAMQAEIRASTEALFPDRPRFVAMKQDRLLPTPEITGKALVDFLLSDNFGTDPVADLRAT